MFYKNDWLVWKYDNVEYGPKLTPTSLFDIHINKTIDRPVKSYYDELIENASIIRDTFSGSLDLLLSGGLDGEVVLRCYHDLRIPVNVFIFRYENYYNKRDADHAITICESLGQQYKVIDFNLEKFFEKEAYDIWKKTFCQGSGFLPIMKMTEYLDGLPIVCAMEPYWSVSSGEWQYEWEERHHSWAIYHKTINHPTITSWYEYSPEIIASHKQLPIIKDLISNRMPSKLSSLTSKHSIHQYYWPDIVLRPKLTGFEGLDLTAHYTSKPKFMLDFDKQFISDGKVSNKTIRVSPTLLDTML